MVAGSVTEFELESERIEPWLVEILETISCAWASMLPPLIKLTLPASGGRKRHLPEDCPLWPSFCHVRACARCGTDGLLELCLENVIDGRLHEALDLGKKKQPTSAQEFVDLERLPYNRDYKGILGNIMSIRKMGRPKYHSRLNGKPQANKQKYSLVPGEAAGDSQAILWEAEVRIRDRLKSCSPLTRRKFWQVHAGAHDVAKHAVWGISARSKQETCRSVF